MAILLKIAKNDNRLVPAIEFNPSLPLGNPKESEMKIKLLI